MNDADRVRDRVDIVSVLEFAGAIIEPDTGAEWTMYCPFHFNVNTPAAGVNILKQVFVCRSCGAAGDVFSAARLFLTQQLGVDPGFVKTVEWVRTFS